MMAVPIRARCVRIGRHRGFGAHSPFRALSAFPRTSRKAQPVQHVDPTEFQAKLMKKIGAVDVIGLLLTVAIAGFCEFRTRDDLPTVAAILGLMAVSSFAFVTRGALA